MTHQVHSRQIYRHSRRKSGEANVGQDSPAWWKSLLPKSIFVATFIPWILYFYGRVYYIAYLKVWNLSESIFPLSRDDSIISGFTTYLIIAIKAIADSGWYIAALFATSVLLVLVSTWRPVTCYVLTILESMALRLYQLKLHVYVTNAHSRAIDFIWFACVMFAISLTLLIVLICGGKWAFEEGTEAAKKEIRLANASQGLPGMVTIHLKKSDGTAESHTGYLVKASSAYAAIYEKGRGVTIYPLSNMVKLISSQSKEMSLEK